MFSGLGPVLSRLEFRLLCRRAVILPSDEMLRQGDATEKKSTVLASSKRVHDMIYLTLGVSPPTSWKKRIGPAAPASGIEEGSYGDSSSGSGSRRGASKRADLGPTDTASLQEILASSGTTGPPEVRPSLA